jgi:hypothetical protein
MLHKRSEIGPLALFDHREHFRHIGGYGALTSRPRELFQ